MATELVIYTDESDKDGAYFSNFYGGVLVRSRDLAPTISSLESCKRKHNLLHEIKWSKVTANYLGKYVAVMDEFFDFVAADVAKVRIMFTSNQFVPVGLTSEQKKTEYHRLYYQFVKHAFGLQFCGNELSPPVGVRLNIDQMPTSKEDTAQFKSYVEGLHRNPELRAAGVRFSAQQIAEVRSHDHVLLQCLDIVLGAMTFRLNNKHLEKAAGSRYRGKRTVAKHDLYQHLSRRVRAIYPGFNIGESTGWQGDRANSWKHPYRHWKLVPRDYDRDLSKAKP